MAAGKPSRPEFVFVWIVIVLLCIGFWYFVGRVIF